MRLAHMLARHSPQLIFIVPRVTRLPKVSHRFNSRESSLSIPANSKMTSSIAKRTIIAWTVGTPTVLVSGLLQKMFPS